MDKIIAADVHDVLSRPLPWTRLAGKSVLITGASGFIGGWCVHVTMALSRVLAEPCRVTALVRRASGAQALSNLYPELRMIVQDVCAPLPSEAAPDILMHAASQASPKYYGTDPVGTFAANTLGTNNMLALARQAKSEKVLFISSSEVYGSRTAETSTAEGDYGFVDPMQVRSCYAESKRAGETLCVAYQHQYGVPVVIARPFHIYGPGLDLQDGRVQAEFVRSVVEGKPIVLHSDGSATRSFCYISDAVSGLFYLLLNGENGEAYNVGNEAGELSIRAVAELLATMAKPPIAVQFQNAPTAGYIPSRVVRMNPDTGKLRALGWEPRISPEEGFRRTVEWYSRRAT